MIKMKLDIFLVQEVKHLQVNIQKVKIT